MSKAKRQARRAARKERRKERRAAGNTFIQKVGKAIKKTAHAMGNVALAPLLPFKGMMQEQLKKRNYPAPNDLTELARSYHKHIIKGQSFETIDLTEREEGIIDDIVGIVRDIINFFKKTKKKSEDGELMTDIEKEVSGGLEDVNQKIEDAETGTDSTGAGSGFIKYILIAIAAVIVLKVVSK